MGESSTQDVVVFGAAFVVGAVAGGVLTSGPLTSPTVLKNVALGGVTGVILLFGGIELIAVLSGLAILLFKSAQRVLDRND